MLMSLYLTLTKPKPVNMKKLFTLLVAMVFALAFVACGGGASTEAETTEAVEETAEEVVEEAEEATEEVEEAAEEAMDEAEDAMEEGEEAAEEAAEEVEEEATQE